MTQNWKASITILAWFIVFAVLKLAKVETAGYLDGLLVAAGWFLLIPLLLEAGVSKASSQWFQKAGLFAIFSSAFGLVALTLLRNTGAWYLYVTDFGMIASGFFAIIGALVGFLEWKK